MTSQARQRGTTEIASIVKERLIAAMVYGNNDVVSAISLTSLAIEFEVSPRTLRRLLKESGNSYLDILEAVRKPAALEWVNSTLLPVADIAEILGFKSYHSFSSAFKRWYGDTPQNYRRNHYWQRAA